MNLDQLAVGMRLLHGKSFFLEAYQMELDLLMDEFHDFGPVLAYRYTAAKIRDIGAKTGRPLFDDD